MRLSLTRRPRNSSGAGIAEGAASVILLCIIIVAGTLFLFGAGAAGYYKYKIGTVADRTAEYLATLVYFAGAANPNFSGAALPQRAKELADRLLSDSGLPPASTVQASVSGRLLTVRVTVTNLKLFQAHSSIPATITLSDSAVVPIARTEPPGLMSFSDGTTTLYVPVYGRPSNTAFYTWNPAAFQASEGLPAGSLFSYTP